jgi:CubicO group peptidase (beta-lactamase class C family)
LIAWAARDPLKFTPGISFSYSRVGYLLLGALVEKLYGKPYDAVLRDEIARPLGLTTLGWCAEAANGTSEATGYEEVSPSDRRTVPNLHPSKELGAGGICATAGDLNAWTRALHGGRVLSSTSYATFTTSIKSLERPAIAECCFMVVPRGRGVARLTLHREDGFSSEIAWFARDSLSVTVLYNTSGEGIIGLLPLEIADAVMKPAKTYPIFLRASATLARSMSPLPQASTKR